jgi:hypothetical protein
MAVRRQEDRADVRRLGPICDSGRLEILRLRRRCCDEDSRMLAIVGLLVILAATAVRNVQLPGALQGAPFGKMSREWLAENHASHPS